MTSRTGHGEKFAAARSFLRDNPSISNQIPSWSRMRWRSLYPSLIALGIKWNMGQHVWEREFGGSTATTEVIKRTPRPLDASHETVLVRIMAHRDSIEQAVSELLELARASNLTVLSVSEPVNNRAGDFKRVYVKLHLYKARAK